MRAVTGVRTWLVLLVRVWRVAPVPVSIMAVVAWTAAVLPGLQVALTAQLVNAAIAVAQGDEAASGVLAPIIGIAVISIAIQLASSVVTYLGGVASLRFTTEAGVLVMTRGVATDLSAYEDPDHYNALQRAVQETQSGRPFALLTGFVQLVGSTLTLVSVGVALVSWNPLAAAIALLSPLPAAVVTTVFGRVGWQIQNERMEKRRETGYLQWLTTNDQTFKEVAHFRLGATLISRYRRLADEFYRIDKRLLSTSEAWLLGANLIGAGGSVLALYLAAGSPTQDVAGTLAAFLQALGSLSVTSRALLMGIASTHQNVLFAGNLFGFLDVPVRPRDDGTREFPAELAIGIEFRGVSFSYPGTDRRVLDRVSFVIPAGEFTAVVGANGSGKSTIVKLLARLYEPDEGVILVDGIDITSFDLDSLRRRMAIVFQDFVKYEFEVQENIAFGRIGDPPSPEELGALLRRVGLDDAIDGLPRGVATRLGRRFVHAEQLSEGQWQRLAIARALISESSVLLLDEPAASLDNRAENSLVDMLVQSRPSATRILITHSPASATAADGVLVMSGGRLQESGSPRELLDHDSAFSALMGPSRHERIEEELS